MGNDAGLEMKINARDLPVVFAAPSWIDVAAVLATAAASRLLLFFFHVDAGDTPTYELLAENIF